MNSTKVERIVQKVMQQIFEQFPVVQKIMKNLEDLSPLARIIVVGGTVRDAFLESPVKDLDIEVYGISLEELMKVLATYGFVRKVGKAFGVLRIDGLSIDWSLPRVDGTGRKPLTKTNSALSYEVAFARRDLTINAMGIDLVSGTLIDPFNGLDDLQNKILRMPHEDFFKEDPLRYFRVMQFMGRFQFLPDQKLYEIGRSMDLTGISSDRIKEEFYKLCVLGNKPSLGLQWLADTHRLQELIPELYAMIGLEQDRIWHPEGDVFEHIKQAVDCAAAQAYGSDEDRYVMVLAATCHDLGKAVATQHIDGRIRALGHDVAGVPIAQKVLDPICISQKLHPRITKLVRWHMTPIALVKNRAGAAAYKRLALRLAPETSCEELGLLVLCDKSARNPERREPLIQCCEPLLNDFLEQAKKHGVLYNAEPPLLTGKDFLDHINPGPGLGELIKKAYEIQIERGVSDKEKLKIIVLKRSKQPLIT